MLVRQMLEIYDLLDTPQASGEAVAALLRERGAQDVTVTVVGGNQGTTDCVKVVIPGRHGKSTGGDAPTLGIVGRLGGIGARPEMIGQVSDGDGALAALTVALKLAEMHHNDDILEGDVIIELIDETTSNRVSFDNLSWTCYSGLATEAAEVKNQKFTIYPNPVKNNQFFISGIDKNETLKIYSLNGQLLQTINNVNNKEKVNLNKLPKGVYFVTTKTQSSKIIVE